MFWCKLLGSIPHISFGQCGSCWSFAATGALEGQIFLKTGNLVPLSKQHLVDCSSKYGNQGCNGGWMTNAYNYIKDKSLSTEAAYPYIAKLDTCKFNGTIVGATLTGFVNLPSGDETKLMEAVATKGPISVAIDASLPSLTFYKDGVYSDPKCSTTVNHGVLIIGYGTDAVGGDYWIVKNSWGPTWGKQGYIHMKRNNNTCGIGLYPNYPLP